jgi:hypothetical protein
MVSITVAEAALSSAVVGMAAVGQNLWLSFRQRRWDNHDRLWQRKSEIYVDLLQWAIRQRERAKRVAFVFPGPPVLPPDIEELLALEAQVSAFGSRKIDLKVDALQKTWGELNSAVSDITTLRSQGYDSAGVRPDWEASIGQAEKRAQVAASEVVRWADELTVLVREELLGLSSGRRGPSWVGFGK